MDPDDGIGLISAPYLHYNISGASLYIAKRSKKKERKKESHSSKIALRWNVLSFKAKRSKIIELFIHFDTTPKKCPVVI